MKTCPSCGKVYEDEQMRFCLEDGNPLVDAPQSRADSNATLVLPPDSTPLSTMRVTQPTPQRTITSAEPRGGLPTYQNDQMAPRRRGAALPILLSAVILGVAAIVVALIVTRNRGENANLATQSVSTSSPVETSQAMPNTQGAANSNDTSRTNNTATTNQTAKPREQTSPAKPPAAPQQTAGSEPPASPPVKSAPRGPISGGVLNGKAVRLVQPAYPAIARSVHASGQVRVQVLIDESGNVISASALSGHPLLQGAAVAAARQSKFTPTTLSGQPVKVSGVIIYNFVAE
jgi:TonB family protein